MVNWVNILCNIDLFLRSLSFYVGFILSVIVFSVLSPLLLPWPILRRYKILTYCARFTIWWLQKTCNLSYQVRGMENIPLQSAVVLSKHQSAWETIAFQQILPFQTWVLKRELLWIPFFGWAIATLKPIAIVRKNIHKSVHQIVDRGQRYLRRGRWVILFPEGTRVPLGKRRRYSLTGSALAIRSNCLVVPVALNSGKFWPPKSFIKYPGTILVSIGPPIVPENKTAWEVNQLAETWIENEITCL